MSGDFAKATQQWNQEGLFLQNKSELNISKSINFESDLIIFSGVRKHT